MIDLRKFMFENVYKEPCGKGRGSQGEGDDRAALYFYKEHLDQLPAKYLRMMDEGESAERVVADYIAGMTDQYAITKFSEYFCLRPGRWTAIKTVSCLRASQGPAGGRLLEWK